MQGRRILVIDDEDDIREIAELALGSVGGFDVLTAASGAEGIETARAQQPDAILLDWMMPEMDGPATFEALRLDTDTRGIPVLMLTAKVQTSDRQRLADLGVAGVLAKPFEPMELSDRVAETLGWDP